MIKIIRRVLKLSGRLSVRIKISFVFSVLDAVFTMLPFGALFYFLRQYSDGLVVTGQTIRVSLILILSGLIGRAVSQYFLYRFQSTAGFEFIANERMSIGEHLKNVSMGFFHQYSLGDITTTVTSDLNFLEMYSMHILDKVTTGMISIIVISCFVLGFDYVIGITFIVGVLLSFIVYNVMQKKGIQYQNRQRNTQNEAISKTLEYIQGISIIKSFHMNEKELTGIKEAFDASEAAAVDSEKVFAPLNALYSLIFRVTSCVIICLASFFMLKGQMDYASFAVILCAAFSIFSPIEVMGQMTQLIRRLDISLDRVEEIKMAKSIDQNSKDQVLKHFNIEFDHVSFAYDSEKDNEKIIDDLSFKIPERTMTAVVGPSGSGKTTITRLIARFWDVSGGSIKIDGVNLKDMTCEGLLKYISMVFQNVYLFGDTIENNIKFGMPDAAHEKVVEAAKKACCHDFIEALPDGYKTVIGEGGQTLSGGEKQRISIARAILKDAPIIILDEATASIDPENERLIQNAIDALIEDKTVIVIAHRLPTIQNANQILVIDEGKLVQQGRHRELVQQEGIYKTYWELQRKAKEWKVSR